MTGANKTSLQRRCAAAGLSTEGTKKDLFARLSIYNSVGTVEAIIYKEAVQVPQNGESSKGQCCGQEIARELQSAIPGQSATGSARWGNPAGLVVLERTDTYNELLDTNKKLLNKAKEQDDRLAEQDNRLASLEARMEATQAHSLAIRNRFFSSFLRDYYPDKYTPGEHKRKVAGDRSAHHGAPLIDSYLYTEGIRSDVNTFVILYGLKPDQISLLRKSRHNMSLISRCGFGRWLKLRWQRCNESFRIPRDSGKQQRWGARGVWRGVSKFYSRYRSWGVL